MEDSIFKKFFRGKCQNPKTGIDPPGCPNPDCPVVCGTPGSIVHFYGELQNRAFNSTVQVIEQMLRPSSEEFKKVEEKMMGAGRVKRVRCTNGETVRAALVAVFGDFRRMMTVECGGPTIVGCSWEAEMKRYILSFP